MTETTAGAGTAIRPLPTLASAAVLGILIAAAVGWSWPALGFAALAVATFPLIAVDVAEHRLPNRIVLPCSLAVLAGVVLHAIATGRPPVLALLSGAACLAGFLLMHVLGGMGMGDVKLAGVIGVALGSLGITAIMAGLFGAFVLGGGAGVWAMARRHRAATHRIPFGPFLLAGLWLGVIAHAASA